jgi:hypothetical protein
MEDNEPMMRADTVKRMPALPCSSIWQLLAGILMMLVVASNPAVAAEVQVYDVEVIVFSNQASGDDGERWPTTIRDDFYTQDFVAEGQFTELPESTFQLNGIAYGLKQSRGYKVLLHTAWRLPARDARNAISIPIDTAVAAEGKVLSGNIKLIRERFLHLDLDLILAAANASTAASYAGESIGSPVYELREKRRIRRSNTVHYFDHPRFGVIATLTPHTTQEQARALMEAEAEAEERERAAAEAAAAAEEPQPDDQLTR